MPIPETIIRYTRLKNTRGRYTGEVRASLLNNEGDEVCYRDGKNKQEALEALLVVCQQMGEALRYGGPEFLIGEKETLVIYPSFEGKWAYGTYRQKHRLSNIGGLYDTQQACERAARSHLADYDWDGFALTSPHIKNAEDQKKFTEHCIWAIQMRVLTTLGWEQQEANLILDGLGHHYIAPERYQQMPPMSELARKMSPQAWLMLEHFANQAKARKHKYCDVLISASDLGNLVSGDASAINTVNVYTSPTTPQEQALRELVDQGILEESPENQQHFRFALRPEVIQTGF